MFESHFQTKGLILEQRAYKRAEMPLLNSSLNDESLEDRNINLLKAPGND